MNKRNLERAPSCAESGRDQRPLAESHLEGKTWQQSLDLERKRKIYDYSGMDLLECHLLASVGSSEYKSPLNSWGHHFLIFQLQL